MPKLAVFPKAFMQALCKDGTMKLNEWIKLASALVIDGLEWYSGFLEMKDRKNWAGFRKEVEGYGKSIPMMCCSPDFTFTLCSGKSAGFNGWISIEDGIEGMDQLEEV